MAEAGAPHILVYRRDDHRAWVSMSHIGVASVLDLPALGCRLPLSDLYRNVPPTEPRSP